LRPVAADACPVQGHVGHPAGNYGRVIDAVRTDLEASGAPAFVAVTVTPGWDVRPGPLVFASVGPCKAQADVMAARVEPGEMVLVVSRQVQGERQSYCVMSADTLSTIHRSREVLDDRRAGAGPIAA
jgi:hypothetical protein